MLDRLLEPASADLAARLGDVPGLEPSEQDAIREGAARALGASVLRKVNRVLLLELNAARVSGRLTAADPAARWDQWIAEACRPGFWEALTDHYPGLLRRLRAVIGNACDAALTTGVRFAEARDSLARLPGAGSGTLTGITFGAGDTHRGGQSVALLTTTTGQVVYKPRSVDVDTRLARLLDTVIAGHPAGTRIRVPQVLARPDHGWSEHVQHRYCADERELNAFYLGIGHWLAVMRLLGGSDLHAENVIAAGPVPVVVDCETLFTPHTAVVPSGYGRAVDRAAELLGDSVLRIGLLPGRGQALGWRGVDLSAVGSLPGQQPVLSMPVIVGLGTDEARMDYAQVPIAASRNHPSPDPVLHRYWDRVVEGFTGLTEELHRLDRSGHLAEPLAAFADCPVRVVVRATETSQELARMLWHPASLHDEPASVERARALLAGHAANASAAPGDLAVIKAEVADLLDGDVPVFTTTPREGRLTGPRGTGFGPARDLIADTLGRWRADDSVLDRQVIQGTLVSAYLNEGWLPDRKPMRPARVTAEQLDRRRRDQASAIVRRLRDAAIRADDGTVAWIAPVLDGTGWSIQPMANDLYGGLSGAAVLLAAYRFEAARGRADAVDGLDVLLADTLRTLRATEAQEERDRAGSMALRPDAPGGFVGLGSRIWAWLLLGRMDASGVEPEQALARALRLAGRLPEAVAADDALDLFRGMAGAVVPLLRLAQYSGEPRWSALADDTGTRLVRAADVRAADTGSAGGGGGGSAGAGTAGAGTARWGSPHFPDGVGGMAHGATGIGWALARLAAADTGVQEVTAAVGRTAEAAFAFEESTYDPALAGWIDLRAPGHTGAAWCHGAGGIGLAAVDLIRHGRDPDCGPDRHRDRWRDVLRRAAASCWADGVGWNHTLCHGDFGVWEVVDHALSAGVAPVGLDRPALDAHLISGLEEYGPISGLARDTFAPGLLPGVGGIAYQLLRMHPDSPLPSVLLPDPGHPTPL
ncbi:type 2 lantipeptide synthetase LanM [Streptacidiphilus sp. PB12-B1b]|nr:type 2 lantipeptide synthetase LanM [Streptacidiphilus sp. PB12-B1b]